MNKNTNIKERRVLNIPKESFNTIKEYCNSNSLDMIQWLTNNSLEKINSSLVRKWKLTGLLQFLTPEKEIECAILLEKTGNIIKHETNMKCPMGSNIVVYEDKLTNTLTEHWPMTGSYFVDITEQRFTDIKNGTYVPKFTL